MAIPPVSCSVRPCTKCKSEFPATSEFWHACRKSSDGLHWSCKQCRSQIAKGHYAQKRAIVISRSKARFDADPARQRAQGRAYYAANCERLKEKVRRRKEAERDKINARNRELYAADRERRRARSNEASARRRAEKPEAVRAYMVKWRNGRPERRLRHTIGNAIRLALVKRKAGRRWEGLVGYDLPTLMRHLERQFLAGMTWENYGPVWHVDHIVPAAAFKYEAPEDAEFRACWALTNLRPLWAPINLSKKATRTHLL